MTLTVDPPPMSAKPSKSVFWRRLDRPVDHRVAIPDLPLPVLEEALDKFLELELEEGTWDNYRRTYSEAKRFAEHHGLPVNEHTGTLWLVAVHQDPRRKISLSGLLSYAKQLSAILSRVDEASGELRVFIRILVKLGAAIPEHQAVPITKEEVYEMLDDPRFTEEEKMLVYFGWKSAARASDLQHLDCRNVYEHRHQHRRLLVVLWIPTATPGSLASGRIKHAHGKIHACVLDCGRYTDRLLAYLHGRRPFTCMTTRQISQLLTKIRQDLTAHSLKRGALCCLVEQCTPIPLIVRMARHRNPLYDLPQHTQTYLPHRHLALLLGTQEATRKL